MPNARILALVFGLVLIGLIGGIYLSLQQPFLRNGVYSVVSALVDAPPDDDPTPHQFTVSEGETAGSIAQRLEREGFIRNAWGFTMLARMRGVDERLEAGVYSLRRNMTANQVLDELMAGRYAGTQVTFPEGWRAAEMAALLESKEVLAGGEFLQLALSGDFRYDFLADRPPSASLEGYLFPDTYRTPPGTTARELVDRMLQNFGQKFTPEMRRQAAARGLTVHQVVTLASIVEREAVVASERPTIASVFFNRLEADMPLQADATVQYAKAEKEARSALATSYWPKGLTLDDLAIDSPYNTYRYRGLPPGPICCPGLDSIKAVLECPPTDYYYYVAKGDGSHVFAKTLEEHNQNVAKYQMGGSQ